MIVIETFDCLGVYVPCFLKTDDVGIYLLYKLSDSLPSVQIANTMDVVREKTEYNGAVLLDVGDAAGSSKVGL